MPNTEDIFNYVMDTPDNTNPNVLRSLLNGLEGGSGGGTFITNVDVTSEGNYTYYTLDKTWQEIYDASSSSAVIAKTNGNGWFQFTYLKSVNENEHSVEFLNNSIYYADSANEYPVHVESGK